VNKMTSSRYPRLSAFILGAWLLLWSQGVCYAGEVRLALEVARPAGGNLHLTISVVKDYGTIRVPYAGAEVTVTGPEEFCQVFTADPMGRVKVNPAAIMGGLKAPPERMELQVSVRLGEQTAQATTTLSHDELAAYVEQTAEALIEEGDRLAEEGELRAMSPHHPGQPSGWHWPARSWGCSTWLWGGIRITCCCPRRTFRAAIR